MESSPNLPSEAQADAARLRDMIMGFHNEQPDRMAAGEIQRLVQQSEVEGSDDRIRALPVEHS